MVPEGWRNKPLLEIATIKHGFAFSSEYFCPDGGDVVLTPGNFHEEGGFRNQGAKQKRYAGPIPDGYLLKPGDMLVAMTEQGPGLLGSTLFVPEGARYLHNQRLGLVSIIRKDELDLRYLHIFMSLPVVRQKVSAESGGTKVKHTSPSKILSLEIPLPPLPEQHKIAEILSTWDKAIETTEALLANARTHKRALMQSLLTGTRRFPGFEDHPWREVRLGDLCEICKGAQKSKNTLDATGAYPVINGGVSPSGYTDEWNTEAGTITISEGGNSCGFANLLEVRFWSGGHCYTLEALKVNRDYLFHWLKFREVAIMKLRVGSGLPNIQKKAISAFPVSVPELGEQVKIAEAISCALKEENLLVCRIDQFRTEKKALMQQLLTGKRRVNVEAADEV